MRVPSPPATQRIDVDSQNPPGVRFQQGDAARLPFADGSFDVVFTRYMLLHVPDPPAVVREMLRVTRPGGFTVAFEPGVPLRRHQVLVSGQLARCEQRVTQSVRATPALR